MSASKNGNAVALVHRRGAMASKRRIRKKQCVGKCKYDSLAFAESMALRARRRTSDDIRAYACGGCGGFHIGHWNAKKTVY